MALKVRLDEICDSKISTISSEYSGQIEYIDISSVDNVQKKIISSQFFDAREAPSRAKQLIRYGDILVSMVRPNLNAVALVQKESNQLLVASTGYCILRCKSDVNNRYLFYFCQSPTFIDALTAQATGASYPAVNSSIIKNCLIPLPPLEIQERIATTFDRVSGLISLRKQQLAKLDELVKARFVEIMNSADLGKETTIEALTNRVKVGFVGTCERYYTDNNGVPMIRTGNITENGIDLKGLKYVTADFHKNNRKSQIHTGDLLIARHGSNGQTNVYEGPEAQCLNAVIIVPNQNIASSVFLAGLMNSSFVKTQIDHTLVGSTQNVINTKSIAKLKVRIPSIEVQKKYELFVQLVAKRRLTIQQGLDKLEMLKKALMQEFFGGGEIND